MTSQTVSIWNIKGGETLNAWQAREVAALLEKALPTLAPSYMRDSAKMRRVIRVLRGEAPVASIEVLA